MPFDFGTAIPTNVIMAIISFRHDCALSCRPLHQICTIDEAKQFYPLFGVGANVALVFSGRTVRYFSQLRGKLPPGVDGWGMSLKGMMSLVVALGLAICAVYWWVNKFVVNDPNLPKVEKRKKVRECDAHFSAVVHECAQLLSSYCVRVYRRKSPR